MRNAKIKNWLISKKESLGWALNRFKNKDLYLVVMRGKLNLTKALEALFSLPRITPKVN